MSIALLCAIPPEWRHLHDAMAGVRSERVAGLDFVRGRLDAHDVVLVQAGIGKVNTAMVTTLLVERFGAEIVLFSGVAGGLDPELAIGDVVVGVETYQHDAGVIDDGEFQPYQAGHVPFFNPTDRFGWRASDGLVAKARAAFADIALPPLSREAGGPGRPPVVTFGTVVSGDQYIHCDATRVKLHERYRAQAAEMEGGALGQVAAAMGVDWLDIRALSDLAGATSRFDFASFVDEVSASSARLLRRLLPEL
ncbi:MAG: 5'-methylthioadenosine/adenosylhomocysteine nucleosidase [Alphaproteobacteria bacterium]|jgi:adenosylhomocysteine nucleosidase|nr:5'-methylthioadenosine/adenosylhomocysteine nucleosidase [Alphaproteobacteria bacterium]